MSEPPVNVSAEGVHAEPRKVGHRLLDFSIALSAIVISLISLAVAIHHGRVQERLVAANSWPFLFWSTSVDQDANGQRFSIYIANSGVGPAWRNADADQPDASAAEPAALGAPDGRAPGARGRGLLLLHSR